MLFVYDSGAGACRQSPIRYNPQNCNATIRLAGACRQSPIRYNRPPENAYFSRRFLIPRFLKKHELERRIFNFLPFFSKEDFHLPELCICY